MEEYSEETASSVVCVPFIQEKKIITAAAIILAADQATKQIVVNTIEQKSGEIVVVEGFLKLVYWTNSGAAWSMFQNSSIPLAILSLVALIALIRFRHQFEIETSTGKIAIGMLIGGILGNMIDRIAHQHVIDFIRFNRNRRGGGELGYPAFNIADVGICVGVGLMFVMTWREQKREEKGENEKKGP